MSFASKHPVPYRVASWALRFSLVMIALIAALALFGAAIEGGVSALWGLLTRG